MTQKSELRSEYRTLVVPHNTIGGDVMGFFAVIGIIAIVIIIGLFLLGGAGLLVDGLIKLVIGVVVLLVLVFAFRGCAAVIF
jgi:hypothetical protein